MFWVKSFKSKKERVLAACDRELLGKKLESDGHDIEVSEGFYGGEIVESEEELARRMEYCTIANLIGDKAVGVAKKRGFITEENIISIGGVPHAQFVKL
jgi:hypothetical protein